MKHYQLKYCQFHRCDTSHYTSEWGRKPANLRNSRMAENVKKRTTSRCYNKPTTRRKQHPRAGKPEASKIFRKINTLFSSSEDEKEYTPELVALKE